VNNYVIRQSAKDDLKEIWHYTANKWNFEQADYYIRGFFKRFEWLAENPQLGKHRADVHTGYYSYPEGKHNIFYVISENTIEIIGIIHERIDAPRYFD